MLLDSVNYLGHRIDMEEIHPTEDKMEAICNTPAPQNVQQLHVFLGSLNYYGKFLHNLATVTIHPLSKLLWKGTKWAWTKECQKSFEEAKLMLKMVIHYFR